MPPLISLPFSHTCTHTHTSTASHPLKEGWRAQTLQLQLQSSAACQRQRTASPRTSLRHLALRVMTGAQFSRVLEFARAWC